MANSKTIPAVWVLFQDHEESFFYCTLRLGWLDTNHCILFKVIASYVFDSVTERKYFLCLFNLFVM